MRYLAALFLILVFLSDANAFDLGTKPSNTKTNTHVGHNPGTPDGRQGGEDISSAILIHSIPFSDTGNTSDNFDDYDADCPYSTSTSPDVVYRFTPEFDLPLTVDLCGSGYDTKTYIMDADLNIIACNDDFYSDEICGSYVSMIEFADLSAGTEYFIVIDGYGEDAGDYILEVREYEFPAPCILPCSGLNEGEPSLQDGYEDAYNGGCNSPEFGNPYVDLTEMTDNIGELTLCGVSGWFNDNTNRDTDWMYIRFGPLGLIEWTLDAEYPVFGFLLGGDCAAGITVDEQMNAGPCTPANMIIQGSPYQDIQVWVGPTEYSGPSGFVGHEFNYVAHFTGLDPIIGSATEKRSFGQIKSLYR